MHKGSLTLPYRKLLSGLSVLSLTYIIRECAHKSNTFAIILNSLSLEIKEREDAGNVYLVKDGTLFLLFRRKDFENMTSAKYEYVKGNNGHFEIALYVDTFEEVDLEYEKAIAKGAVSVLAPTTEPWGQRTCYIADPEGNLVEIGSWNKPYEEKDK